MALLDAWELAQQLVTGGHSSAQAAITDFSIKSAPRSLQPIKISRWFMYVAHSKGLTQLLYIVVFKTTGILLHMFNSLKALRKFRSKPS